MSVAMQNPNRLPIFSRVYRFFSTPSNEPCLNTDVLIYKHRMIMGGKISWDRV